MTTDEDEDTCTPTQSCSKPVWSLVFFLLLWQAVYHVSNAAILSLLSYFAVFVGNAFQCQSLILMAENIPHSYPKLRKLLGMSDNFIEYVVCPKCNSIYAYEDCVIVRNGVKKAKVCCHVAFPSHPHTSQRTPCNSQLLKKVKTNKGHSLVPLCVYPYYPLVKSLERLAAKPGFIQSCEKWRERNICVPNNILGDIYDGDIWKDFTSETKGRFLVSPHSYLLTLNVDWFQPFTHSVYSIGAIYLTVQNLPRHERFREENIILVGILPGPKEPQLSINSYLSPLIEELKTSWETGFLVHSPQGLPITIRLALACVASDIPATRKVCGFLGHNAAYGCNKCMKKFLVSFGTPTDYSGCNRDTWQLRTAELHREQCREVSAEITKTGMQKVESKYGVRCSVLLGLPYYDPIKFVAIDTNAQSVSWNWEKNVQTLG